MTFHLYANWKMNGSVQAARELALGCAALRHRCPRLELALFPSYPHLITVASAVAGSGIELGAQDVSPHAFAAMTGDVSPAMLVDVGCHWVLVGHSERREHYAEGPDRLKAKMVAAAAAGLGVVFCVGESLAERQAGAAERVVFGQMQDLVEVLAQFPDLPCRVAYEPVWAIGTGVSATAVEIEAMHTGLAHWLQERTARPLPLLYGGSVNRGNIAEVVACRDVNGVLVGSASLQLEQVQAMVEAICGNVAEGDA